ncbi:MAG: hypothetical protein WED15_10160 [Akkermansiaceae bacterium]
MDWIQDNFQIVIIVLLALGSWLKARMDAKAAAAEEAAAPPEDFQPEDYFDPEEYFETEDAEWQPPGSVPPPLERRVPPPLVMPSVIPAAAQQAARDHAAVLKHQQELAERLRQIRETKATTIGNASATRQRYAAQEAARTHKGGGVPRVTVPLSLRDRLDDRRELRRALVMREILNPPPGLS